MRAPWSEFHGVDDESRPTYRQARTVLGRVLRWLRPRRGSLLVIVALTLTIGLLQLAGPQIVRLGIDRGVRRSDIGYLRGAAGIYLLVAIIMLVVSRAQLIAVNQVGEWFLRELRDRVFGHMMRQGLEFFDAEPTGRLVARMTSDIDSLGELVQSGISAISVNVLSFVGSIVVLFAMSARLAAVSLVTFPLVVVASIWFRRASNRAYLALRDRIAVTMGGVQELVTGVRVVQSYARETAELAKFDLTNEAQFKADLKTSRISSVYFSSIDFSGVLASAIAIWIGGRFVDSGSLTIGVVVAFILYLSNLFDPIQQLSQLFNTVQSATAALTKLFGVLDRPPATRQRPGAVDLPSGASVEFEKVFFSYSNGEPVLSDLSFVVRGGERLAVVGPTGAGKSTVAKLVSRFYDPVKGRVLVAGVDLRDTTNKSLEKKVLVAPQEGFLFSGTIFDNVVIANPLATLGLVCDALDLVGALERFEALPEGLDTQVNERGSRLSAGERQLISLARVALADPEIIVLDEATSSLDPGSEVIVEAALQRLFEGRTAIVIAHRLSTAERADRVLVVDKGELTEQGSHAELIAKGGSYARLYGAWMASQSPA